MIILLSTRCLSTIALILSLVLLGACSSKITSEDPMEEQEAGEPTNFADIVSVSTSGSSNSYQFSVGIRSPDEDCDLYANWWEVVSLDGALIYRRILAHSHPNEQPFIRSGGPIDISADQEIIIRAYMHPTGYGGTVYQGSVSSGFQAMQKPADFAEELKEVAPLPTVCTG